MVLMKIKKVLMHLQKLPVIHKWNFSVIQVLILKNIVPDLMIYDLQILICRFQEFKIFRFTQDCRFPQDLFQDFHILLMNYESQICPRFCPDFCCWKIYPTFCSYSLLKISRLQIYPRFCPCFTAGRFAQYFWRFQDCRFTQDFVHALQLEDLPNILSRFTIEDLSEFKISRFPLFKISQDFPQDSQDFRVFSRFSCWRFPSRFSRFSQDFQDSRLILKTWL